MSTLERLFMQIFDQKDRIDRQLRQQVDSHCESLAYNLLAGGRRPPPWLWTPFLDAHDRPDFKAPSCKTTGGPAIPDPRGSQPIKEHRFSTSSLNEHYSSANPLLQDGVTHVADETERLGLDDRVSNGSVKEKPLVHKQQSLECCLVPSHWNIPHISAQSSFHATSKTSGSYEKLFDDATEKLSSEFPSNFPTSGTASRHSAANLERNESKCIDAKTTVPESEPVLVAASEGSFHGKVNGARVSSSAHLNGVDTSHTLKDNAVCSGHQEMHESLETVEHGHGSQSILCGNAPSYIPAMASSEFNDACEDPFMVSLDQCKMNQNSGGKQIDKDDDVVLSKHGKRSTAEDAEVPHAVEIHGWDLRKELMFAGNKTPNVHDGPKALNCPCSSRELSVDEMRLVSVVTSKGLDHAVENYIDSCTTVLNNAEIGEKPGARYFLRSSAGYGNGSSLKLNKRKVASDLKRQSKTQHATGNSWPKRRKGSSVLNNVPTTFSRATVGLLLNSQNVSDNLRENEANDATTSMKSQALSLTSNMEMKSTAATVHSCSDALSQRNEKCPRTGQTVVNNLLMEKKVPLNIDNVNDGTLRTTPKCNESTILLTRSRLTETAYSKDIDGHPCAWNISNHETSRCCGTSLKNNAMGTHVNLENSGASHTPMLPDQIPLLPETEKDEVSTVLHDSETRESQSKAQYYLRSSASHEREISLKFSGRSKANDLKRSMETHTSHSKEIDGHPCVSNISNHEASRCCDISVKINEIGMHTNSGILGASHTATIPGQIPVLPETEKEDVFGDVNDVPVLHDIEASGSQSKARYFLRSSVSHERESSLKFCGRSEANDLKRSMETQTSCSKEIDGHTCVWDIPNHETSRCCGVSVNIYEIGAHVNLEILGPSHTATSPDQIPVLLETEKDEIFGDTNDVREMNAKVCSPVLHDIGVREYQSKARYSLRSSTSCERESSLKFSGRSKANDLKRSVETQTSHSKEIDGHLCVWNISNHETSRCSVVSVKINEIGTHANLENLGESHTATFSDQIPVLSGTEKDEVFVPVLHDIGAESQSKAQYFLQSSANHERESCLKLSGRSETNDLKSSLETRLHTSGKSWPQNRKRNIFSSDVTGRMVRSRLHSQIGCNSHSMNPENVISQGNERCLRKGSYCLIAMDPSMENNLTLEQKAVHFPTDDDVGNALSKVSSPISAGTVVSTHRVAENYASEENADHFCVGNASKHERPKSSGFSTESNDRAIENLECSHRSQNASSPVYNSEIVDGLEAMPEFEGFSVDFPYIVEHGVFNDLEIQSLEEERASLLERLRSSQSYVTPGSNYAKSKTDTLPELYQSLPTGLSELMKISNSFHVNYDDCKQFSASDNHSFSGLSEVSGVGKSYSESTMPYACSRFEQVKRKPPSTPPVRKLSQRNLSGASGPEFSCFRIDENSSITEENDRQDGIDMFEERDCSRKMEEPTSRKALQDVSAVYRNALIPAPVSKSVWKRGSLESVNTELCSDAKVDPSSSLGNACSSKDIKRKLSHSVLENGVRSRFGRTEASGQANERNRSQAKAEIGSRPNNIVSHISTFIPLVRQKQQATTMNRKKDVRVKALEVAEAAKRLEEKKQNEREMRKAAAKVERERLKQERELKQKQKEQKKKKELDVATRKRHREDDEKREIERKRKCTGESRKPPKHAEKVEKEQRNDLAEEASRRLKGDEVKGIDREKLESSTVSAVVRDGRPSDRSSVVQGTLKAQNVIESPYEMSPYRDSDEDNDDDDRAEEIRRKRKSVPSWARREILDQILLSNQHLDPREIFARKCSFNLCEVLTPHIPRRQM